MNEARSHMPMTSGARRAVASLFILTIAFAAISIFYTARTTGHVTAEQHAQAAAARSRAQTQRKLDRTVRTLNRTVRQLEQQVRSACRFDGDLAAVPVTVNPSTRQASVLGVKIVSDSRVAWRLAGCPGRLAPPSPSFARWAKFYHLPES